MCFIFVASTGMIAGKNFRASIDRLLLALFGVADISESRLAAEG